MINADEYIQLKINFSNTKRNLHFEINFSIFNTFFTNYFFFIKLLPHYLQINLKEKYFRRNKLECYFFTIKNFSYLGTNKQLRKYLLTNDPNNFWFVFNVNMRPCFSIQWNTIG